MTNLKIFEDLQEAYNNYVLKNSIINKEKYLSSINSCLSFILQKYKEDEGDKNIKFFLNNLKKIRTKIILSTGDEADYKYIADIIYNQDNSKFKIIETGEFYKNLIDFFEHKKNLKKIVSILDKKHKGGFIKGDENLLKIFNELKKKLNNI